MQERLARLVSGIAEIRLGGSSETQLRERKERATDALNAVRAAAEGGILPGGGVALVRATKKVKNLSDKTSDPNVRAGIDIVSRSCLAPFKQIVLNSGKSPDTLLVEILSSAKNIGYDSSEEVVGNMFKLGIVDPKKVVRCAIENASSAASMLLSVGSSMIESSKT